MISNIYRDGLSPYLPEGTADIIANWLLEFKVKIELWNHRKTKLGDFRPANSASFARISVNKSLNPYAFLITIVHEIAHAAVYEKYGRSVQPHGHEWKTEYQNRLFTFYNLHVFPVTLEPLIYDHLLNPKASASADIELEKALRNYSDTKEGTTYLDDLEVGDKFLLSDGRAFIKGEKRRTRHLCKEIKTKRSYLISGLAEVKIASSRAEEKESKPIQENQEQFSDTMNSKTKLTVDNLKIGEKFRLNNGMIFIKGEVKRTRHLCTDPRTGQQYTVHGSLEVERY